MSHDISVVGVQLIAILSGIVVNRRSIKAVRIETDECFREMHAGFDRVDAGLVKIETKLADLNASAINLIGRIEAVEKLG